MNNANIFIRKLSQTVSKLVSFNILCRLLICAVRSATYVPTTDYYSLAPPLPPPPAYSIGYPLYFDDTFSRTVHPIDLLHNF